MGIIGTLPSIAGAGRVTLTLTLDLAPSHIYRPQSESFQVLASFSSKYYLSPTLLPLLKLVYNIDSWSPGDP